MKPSKNLWAIPTDKPSRLFLGNNRSLVFGIIKSSIQSHNDDFTNQNIYITNSEEIKEGEYGLSKLNEVIKFNSGYDYRYYSKITLTTDQDLIKDGVQSIDDEFLEWFVKNPSCEVVEVEKNWNYPLDKSWEYKIIIPKEEPKQEIKFKDVFNDKKKKGVKKLIDESIKKEQSTKDRIMSETSEDTKQKAKDYGNSLVKQETLEEVAKKKYGTSIYDFDQVDAFIEGAKCQAERMYSEEEMLQALNIGFTSTDETWEECVEFAKEQFKKK